MEAKNESIEPRQRRKKLINEVKEALEFYFSAANVSKDKFMQQLLSEDDNIDLEIFFKFNKIKKLTLEVKIIRKAVKKSDILELSEDGSKIKRILPIEFKVDEMECTIYVENLPPNSSHEWLQKVFFLYGTIDYISLPRFQQSGRPKGFAFIEFSSPQEAQKALEAFGGLASLDGTLNPADLRTIRTYDQVEEEPEENDTTSPSSVQAVTDENSKKRSSSVAFESEGAEVDEVSNKKTKPDVKESDSKKKKKKRRRNKKEKEYELQSIYLRVMSKRDWKSLRNKYLNMQRENMSRLKQQIFRQNNQNQSERNETKSNQPKFIPDVIVKLTLNEPPQEPGAFREGLTSGRSSIAYVDINSQDSEVYVRFMTSDAANAYVKESAWENIELLAGEEEKKYWDKLLDCWKRKRPSKKRKVDNVSAPRGREKLISKALKQKDKAPFPAHVIFED